MTWTQLEEFSITTASDFLKFPLTGDYYFYLKIMVGIFLLLTLGIFFEEKKRVGYSNFLSCMAIGAISIIALGLLGNLAGFITLDIFVYILIFGIGVIVTWFFTSD
jgi:hypothetical protein